jgi:hypothetical protein
MEYAKTHGTRTGRTIGRQRIVFRRDVALDSGGWEKATGRLRGTLEYRWGHSIAPFENTSVSTVSASGRFDGYKSV